MNQINEALAQFDSGEQFHDDEWGAILYDIAEGARAYVREWTTCPTCNGSKFVGQHTFNVRPCPDCVDGMIPSPELIERVKRAGYAVYAPDEVDRD